MLLLARYARSSAIISAEWKNVRLVGPHRRAFFFGSLLVPSETVRKQKKMHTILVLCSPYDAAPKHGAEEGDRIAKKL